MDWKDDPQIVMKLLQSASGLRAERLLWRAHDKEDVGRIYLPYMVDGGDKKITFFTKGVMSDEAYERASVNGIVTLTNKFEFTVRMYIPRVCLITTVYDNMNPEAALDLFTVVRGHMIVHRKSSLEEVDHHLTMAMLAAKL